MARAFLNVCSEKELQDPVPILETFEGKRRRRIIQIAIFAIGKLLRFLAILKKESAHISEWKSRSQNSPLPRGTLTLGTDGIKKGNWNSCQPACISFGRLCGG
jgi:hypothetical protein